MPPIQNYAKAFWGFFRSSIKSEEPIFRLAAGAGYGLSAAHVGDRLFIGAAGGAALGGIFGDREAPLSTRLLHGAALGAGIGLFIAPIGYGIGKAGQWTYRTGRWSTGFAGRRMAAAGRRWMAGTGPWYSPGRAYKAFGTFGLMMGAGAIAGGAIGAYEGHPVRGALIGAGAGLGLRVGTGIARQWSQSGFLGKTALTAGGVGLAYGITSALQGPDLSQSVALAPDVAGLPEYGPPGSGVRARMDAMQASGDIVLGLHNRRR